MFASPVETEKLFDYLLFPVKIVSWIIAQPIIFVGWLVEKVKVRVYDPEQRICPACGFRGDSGTAGKVCSVRCIETTGAEKAALKHTCFRCSAEYPSPTVKPAKDWMLQKPLKTE